MRKVEHETDLCVVGGGMAGLLCAVAAARHGIRVILMHDRPVPGGNASSEIRVPIGGAYGRGNRETGILEEICMDNFAVNNGAHMNWSVWDTVLYEKIISEKNLTALFNCSCLDARVENGRVVSVTGWQLTTETYHTVKASYFADCSGDGILAPLTGAGFMLGREARSEFGETFGPDEPDLHTMGMSITFQARETDGPKPFVRPAWAYEYPTEADLPDVAHTLEHHLWWIELGGMNDIIHDTEELKAELLRIAYGVWDHFKNHGAYGYENWELEWMEFLPGKRESRRYKGAYILTQNDVEAGGKFDDTVAYAGWSMDDHFPEGFYYRGGHPTVHHKAPSPWGIPLRSLYSRDLPNLLFAGRDISATHAAFSSARVIATCAMMGQAVGTAVAQAVRDGCPVSGLNIPELQQTLLDDDCFLPGVERAVSPLARRAKVSSEVVRNGRDRGEENLWIGKPGDCIEYTFDQPERVASLRIVFDSDLDRHFSDRYHRSFQNMPHYYPLGEDRFNLPETLVREFAVETVDRGGRVTRSVYENHRRLVRVPIGKTVTAVRLIPLKDNGCGSFRVFSAEPCEE